MILGTIFIIFSIKFILYPNGNDSYTWSGAFMLASILSCTDTITTSELLKELGASKRFKGLIQYESLLNDSSCIILFELAYKLFCG